MLLVTARTPCGLNSYPWRRNRNLKAKWTDYIRTAVTCQWFPMGSQFEYYWIELSGTFNFSCSGMRKSWRVCVSKSDDVMSLIKRRTQSWTSLRDTRSFGKRVARNMPCVVLHNWITRGSWWGSGFYGWRLNCKHLYGWRLNFWPFYD